MILDDIKSELPKDAMISDVSFEGSEIILYTKNKEFFTTSTELIKRIVSRVKKRIEVRADPSIVAEEETTTETIRETVPKEAGIKDIYFEPEFAKVVIHAEKPGLVIGKAGETLLSIKEKTFWTPEIKRAPVIDSDVIRSIRKMLHKEAGYRKKFLNKLGEKIYSPGKEVEWIRATALGAYREVGRSCTLLQTPNTKALLDCGLSVSMLATKPYPYLDAPEFDIQGLDAVILSHAHLDHCLPPQTPVRMAGGSLKPIGEIEDGDEVLSMNWKTGKLEIGRCTATTKTRDHKYVYKINTGNNIIEASPNHRFFVLRNGEVKEVEAQELREGELLPVVSAEASQNAFIKIKSGNSFLYQQVQEIVWQKIESIDILENPYEELIDIEVLPNRNFIAENIIVHNCGVVPFLFEWGYRGPLYCTRPTRDLSVLLQLDYLQICQRENKKALYTSKGIEEAIKHCVTLEYGEVTDIAPDMRLTFQNAGHLLGSAVTHLNIGDGLHNVIYSGDIKYQRTKLFEKTSTDYARCETVIIEATYGTEGTTMATHREGEAELVRQVKKVIGRGGRIIIPAFAVGRSQDIIAILAETDIQVPIYLDGMLWDATAIHTAYPEFMSRGMQSLILHKGRNPFVDPRLKGIGSQKEREKVFETSEPCVVLATSGMLMGGPAVEYLQRFAPDEKNMLLFVGYQAEGTMGRRIQKGWKQVQLEGGRTIELNLEIGTASGLGGHSEQRELLQFLADLRSRPKKILTNHGDNSACVDLARRVHKMLKVESMAPKNLETVRLR